MNLARSANANGIVPRSRIAYPLERVGESGRAVSEEVEPHDQHPGIRRTHARPRRNR